MAQTPLREDIELEAKPLAIGGRRLEILCVKDLAPFVADLEQTGDQGLDGFPFWVKIWEAAIVLTDRLLGMDLPKDQRMLELGAGMGITGLFLGAFGYPVTLSDNNSDALALMRKNAAHNNIDNVQITELDWHHPETTETFDIICGSELIYKQSDARPVIDILDRLLAPGGTVYLAHDISRMSMMHFLAAAEPLFDISHKGMSFSGGGTNKKIVIHTLKRKA